MEYLKSELPKKAYLTELKGCFVSPFTFFRERVTGFVLGSFFTVAHHSDYEWDRRYNMVCSRGWGYVKELEGETEIRFIRWYGFLTPFWLIFFFLLSLLMFFVVFAASGDTFPLIPMVVLSIVLSVVICGVTALGSFLSERGEESQSELTRLLKHPEEYFG